MRSLTVDEAARRDEGSWWGRLPARMLSRLDEGHLRLVLPGGGLIVAHGAKSDLPEAHMKIHRWRAVRRMLLHGDLGFADGYIDGDWSSDDLAALIDLASRNRGAMGKNLNPSLLTRTMHRIAHQFRANTRGGSKRNIEAHYDLGNEFYEKWLDRSMSYSSGLYRSADQTLEQAQSAKQDRVIELMAAPKDARVLEIGCGWGGLAQKMVAAGLDVTGITLSPSQLSYAQSRITDQADLRLQDYRDCEGRFDRIVSIEMIEAVGEKFWPVYFDRLKKLLAPGGRVVLQAITIDESLFDGYRRDVDFIQRSIFPGGCLLSREVIARQFREAGLVLRSVEYFGESYAKTLAEWRRRFLESWPAIEAMGFPPRFEKLWDYYLAYCEGGFRAGSIDVGLYCAEHA
jgi:cyclopropane-fatty-acyl-phospholipid synthase